MVLVLDTHALIWFLADDPRLSPKSREALRSREGVEIIIPIIVLFEIAYLRKRKSLPISLEEIRHWIAGNAHVRVYPTDISVLEASAPLDLEIHDGIIVGTALTVARTGTSDVRLVTCDKAIGGCKAVQTLW